MADDRNDEVANVNGEIEMDEDEGIQESSGDGLREFVQQRYQEQKAAGQLSNSEGVSEDRTNRFFERAIRESQRMSSEVVRSEQRQQQLYQELGAQNIHDWTMEHASEVTVILQENIPPQPNGHAINGHIA